jgi:cytochrome P450
MMPTPAIAISVLVLAAAPWPLIRFISIPSIRREYTRLAIAAATIVCGWYLLIGGLVLVASWLLPPMAAVAGCLLITERWRARGGFGTSKGLPPGSLSLVPRGPWIDERFYAKQAKLHGAVFKMSQFLRPMVCVMGPAKGCDLLDAHSADLTSPAVRFSSFIPKGYIRYMQPSDHAHYKPIFRTAFNRKVLRDCTPDLTAIVRAQLSLFAQASQADPQGKHPATALNDLTFRCILRLFIGVNSESPDYAHLSRLFENVQIGKASSRWRPNDAEAVRPVAEFIESLCREHPDSLPSCFLREINDSHAGNVPDRTVLLNLVYMIRIASSDLSGFLTWATKLLIDNPEWIGRLGTASTSSGTENDTVTLAVLMIKEMLRMERSEYIFRKAVKDIRYQGFTIPRNWIVRVCIRDGHRDSRTFANPDAFDPDRFRSRTFGRQEYSPLGIGSHACLGGQIINTVGTIFLIELTRSFSVSVLADGDREYGRSHWQPSSSLRIKIHRTQAPPDSGTDRCSQSLKGI